MKLAVFAFSRRGLETATRVRAALAGPEDDCPIYAPERLAGEGTVPIEPPLAAFVGPVFRQRDALIFVGACGIAVRGIAPHVRDKTVDPAVLSVDELARFVIPLLSGHIGGANASGGGAGSHRRDDHRHGYQRQVFRRRLGGGAGTVY